VEFTSYSGRAMTVQLGIHLFTLAANDR